jgi:hypothetical protein
MERIEQNLTITTDSLPFSGSSQYYRHLLETDSQNNPAEPTNLKYKFISISLPPSNSHYFEMILIFP